ncbi:hypothetical protein DHEL01_v210926 [Diaporthe helianthi]|uniref:C2H2-type domain-containing protein n=1 Tax=Diaporthe helianthi TaxID=158607 RepID=A0A2P5HKA6_DIAHE|nr:hypothetical protein DHEL01_v210926 [Diaporthe helianthi]
MMAELSVKDGLKAFVEAKAREVEDDWGKWLTEEERQIAMGHLAAFEEEENAFMEDAWNPENQGRLETHIKGLVDELVENARDEANDSGAAADFNEVDVRNRAKVIIGDGPDSTPGSYTLTGKIEEEVPSGNQDAFLEFTIETAESDFLVSYPRDELDDFEVDDDDILGVGEMSQGMVAPSQFVLQHRLGEDVVQSIEEDTEMADCQESGAIHGDSSDDASSVDLFQAMDEAEEDDPDYNQDPKGKQAQKGKQKDSSEHHRHKNNHLWDVVLDAEKPEGTPAGYICKINSCNGWQGKWGGRQTHFETKHPEEWFALTGKRPKVFTCPVEGCGWSTNGVSYLRKHKKDKHGLTEE